MSKYTRKAIIDSFMTLLHQNSLDKITVKDIIETAEVNRNTFYYYFQDIYDLLNQIFEEESEKFRSESDPDGAFHEEYIRLAKFFHDQKEAIIHIYNSKSRDVLQRYLESVTGLFVSSYVDKAAEGTALSRKGKEFITYFYIYAIIGATMRWVESQMKDIKEDLIQTMAVSFEVTIDDMIQAYIQGHPSECD